MHVRSSLKGQGPSPQRATHSFAFLFSPSCLLPVSPPLYDFVDPLHSPPPEMAYDSPKSSYFASGSAGGVPPPSEAWAPSTVAEPPELSRLKCAGHHHKGNTGSNALQMEQFLVCRVTSRYNHRFSDRTSIPRTKASLEILQSHVLQHKLSSDYKPVQTIIT